MLIQFLINVINKDHIMNNYKVTYERPDHTVGSKVVYSQRSKQDAENYISIVLGVKVIASCKVEC